MECNEFFVPLAVGAVAPYVTAAVVDWISRSGRHGFGAHAPGWLNSLVQKR